MKTSSTDGRRAEVGDLKGEEEAQGSREALRSRGPPEAEGSEGRSSGDQPQRSAALGS